MRTPQQPAWSERLYSLAVSPCEFSIMGRRREKYNIVDGRVLAAFQIDIKICRLEIFAEKVVWNKNRELEKITRSPFNA